MMSDYERTEEIMSSIFTETHSLHESQIAELYNSTVLKKRYDILVSNVADLITTICDGKPDLYKAFSVYYHLVWNGYFSKDKSFIYGAPDGEIKYSLGVSIVSGKGVCRNIASFMCDVFNKLNQNYNSCIICVKSRKEDAFNSKYSTMQKQVDGSHESQSRTKSGVIYNHMNALIACNKGFYILDPTNCIVYKLGELDTFDERNALDLRFNVSRIDNIEGRRKALKSIEGLNQNLSNRSQIKLPDVFLREYLDEAEEACQRHQRDIKRFLWTNYDNIEKIASSVPTVSKNLEERGKELRKSYGN